MSEFASVVRPLSAVAIDPPLIAKQQAPRPEQTQRVQPVGAAPGSSATSDRPNTPDDLQTLQNSNDRVAPPTLMQLQISAWLEAQRDLPEPPEPRPETSANCPDAGQLPAPDDDSG